MNRGKDPMKQRHYPKKVNTKMSLLKIMNIRNWIRSVKNCF